ncbi:hypothetical protein PACTADRAFT_50761 [Pachysolen tannophilus NRRL Y-2460]|uniref:Amino acid permease/ SLC12A domain-containing protein n=1 Tax=Pachysolen tannophilus NRRL Y-2460 TaxID=669874 RepID=A0A1E4TT67_PACTA|nr:hypothetical protein PACTADRAFT_50761 [Pachysolen tannophilus NRRL Y-2460]
MSLSKTPTQDKDLEIKVTVSRYRNIDPGHIDPKHAQTDNELLAEIGYKAELRRQFSTLQVFGVAFSIMGLLPSISSVLAQALTGGTVGMIWGWFIASFFVLLIGISMSELGSAMPTSGGLYYWSWFYAPEKWKVPISYIVGNTNSVALVGALCSVNYGFANEVLAAVYISKDGDFTLTTGKTYGVFAACVVSHIFITCAASHVCSRLQTVSIICNLGLILLFFIAVPIGTKINMGGFNDGKFIFGNYQNFSGGWDNGWNFVLNGWMPSIWTIGAFDSCVHMSEEARNATKSVPIGIIGSISACFSLGFFICIVVGACIRTDIDAVIGTAFGQPMAQIVYDSLGKNWAIAFMSLIAACQWLMGASILTAISRQIWAFSRDNGLPFSKYIKVVNKKLSTPLRAVWFGGILSLIMGLLCLIGTTAADALFSLYIAGNYFAWCVPIFLRNTYGRDKFIPGDFYLGKFWSPIVNWISIFFMTFVIIMVMFPSGTTVDKETMNYTVVITPGVMLLAWIYYFAYGKKEFNGPARNVDDMTEYVDGEELDDDQEIIVINSATGEQVNPADLQLNSLGSTEKTV